MSRILLALAMSGSVLAATEERAPLDRARVVEALQRGLGDVQADIEIVEYSSFPAPAGEIVFEWSGLIRANSPMAATRWNGYVRRPEGQRFSIWAIVRLEADIVQVIATESLKVGQAIRADQVREEAYRGFPSKDHLLRADQVVGKVPLHPIRDGALIRPDNLAAVPLIRRGGSTTADYRNSGVHLRLNVIAEQEGHAGERIRVRSTSSQKVMYGLVLGDGTVVVSGTEEGSRPSERKSNP